MAIREAVHATDSARRARDRRPARVPPARTPARAGAGHRRGPDGRRAAGRPGERDHAAGAARCRLRRDGEPRRKRPGGPASDQAGAHHLHLPGGGHRRQRCPEGGLPSRGEPGARAGLLDPRQPGAYNAFDLDLQLWVGACLYKGGVDIYRIFVGELDDEDADRHYREGMALATTLQVPPEMWPADRAAFDRYWQESLAKVHIDDAVRDYLYPDRREPRPGRGAAAPAAAPLGQLCLADHHGLSAAAVSRRDAVALGRRQATALRPADGGAAHGEPH